MLLLAHGPDIETGLWGRFVAWGTADLLGASVLLLCAMGVVVYLGTRTRGRGRGKGPRR
ncbi:hypothetical protein [Streptomyces sp. TRM64462]|uniref:hypothetical protein n=1 Tax=Streptomyces sp. TRM64462 TaxID=2741726 RepID=UPI0015863E86|nr:hypothetical protein [Streptomyces sp. TRM64462]